jgi:Flp pilus assembly protein TadD
MGRILLMVAALLLAGLLACPASAWAQGKAPEVIRGTKKVTGQEVPGKSPRQGKQAAAPPEVAADPSYQQGLKYLQADNYDKAIKAFQQVLKNKPDSAEVHYQLGLAQAGKGNQDQAVKSFQEALRLKPGYAEARLSLGGLYAQRGVNLLQQGNPEAAVGPLKEAISQNPKNDKAYSNLGVALAQQSRWGEAIEAMKAAVDLNPNNAQAQFNLGLSYYLTGDKDGAAQQYAVTSVLDPDAAEELFRAIQGTSQVATPFRY